MLPKRIFFPNDSLWWLRLSRNSQELVILVVPIHFQPNAPSWFDATNNETHDVCNGGHVLGWMASSVSCFYGISEWFLLREHLRFCAQKSCIPWCSLACATLKLVISLLVLTGSRSERLRRTNCVLACPSSRVIQCGISKQKENLVLAIRQVFVGQGIPNGLDVTCGFIVSDQTPIYTSSRRTKSQQRRYGTHWLLVTF